MTEYQKLMQKSDEACEKAIAFYQKKDWESCLFWKNVSSNLREKALNLPWRE